ncbi:MAG: winged helix-turn-helix domain-containing protein [Ekhidna sp.]
MKTIKITSQLELLVDRNELKDRTSGESIYLEPRLSKILIILLKHRGRVVTREFLIDAIWGNYNSGQELLTHSISMLRKKIGNDLIKTIPTKGYVVESIHPQVSFPVITILPNYYWILTVGALFILKMILSHH